MNLISGIEGKAETAEKLVEIEKNIETIRIKAQRDTHNEFIDLTKWLFMLYNN
jgi:hypothetical protein